MIKTFVVQHRWGHGELEWIDSKMQWDTAKENPERFWLPDDGTTPLKVIEGGRLVPVNDAEIDFIFYDPCFNPNER